MLLFNSYDDGYLQENTAINQDGSKKMSSLCYLFLATSAITENENSGVF